MTNFFLALLLANSVFGQICSRVSHKSAKDLDNLGIAQAGCSVSNIIKPYAASNLPWDPSSVPSRGYYRVNVTFDVPELITSCDFWASTDGSHNPTGVKLYDKPGGTLLASTTSFTTKMTQKSYNFLIIPPVVLPFIYVEIYKSTTWQVFVDTLSCNTCYDPSETPTPTVSKSVTRSVSPVSGSVTPQITVTSTVSSSEASSIGTSESVSGTITESYTPTNAASLTITESPSPTTAASLSPTRSLTVSVTTTPTVTLSESVTHTRTLTVSPTDSVTLTVSHTHSLSVSPTYSITVSHTDALTVSPTRSATNSVSPTKTLSKSLSITRSSSESGAPTSSESESPSPIFKQSPIPISIVMSNSTASPVNGTLATIISDLVDRNLLVGIGGAALGASSLALLIMAAKYISKKFAPGPDGKRPSVSEVASSLFSSAKAKATEIMEDVKGDIEQQVKAVIKDPKLALAAMKDPNAALKSIKEGVALNVNRVVTKHVPASQQSAVLKMVKQVAPSAPVAPAVVTKPVSVDDVAVEDVTTDAPPADAALPNQVPEVAATGNSVNIQIDESQLEMVQQMLTLMNKPRAVVSTTSDQPSL